MKFTILKFYRTIHLLLFSLLVTSVALLPFAWGYSIWGIGLSLIMLAVVQIIAGVFARLYPNNFNLKALWKLDLWGALSIIDLVILSISIQYDWFEMILGAMLMGLCLSVFQYTTLTSRNIKY